MGITDRINEAVADSFVGRRFRLEGSGHLKTRKGARFTNEIRAGFATFFVSRSTNLFNSLGKLC